MTSNVTLRDTDNGDLPIFFEQQLDPAATAMAGFPSREREPFMAHWARIMADETIDTQTILSAGQVAGNIGSWEQDGQRLVGYWLGQEFWGKGIATAALALFIDQVKTRPLYAYIAKHNIGSRRVLEKCGFSLFGEDSEEYTLRLGEE